MVKCLLVIQSLLYLVDVIFWPDMRFKFENTLKGCLCTLDLGTKLSYMSTWIDAAHISLF
jgi:hypothetical protein